MKIKEWIKNVYEGIYSGKDLFTVAGFLFLIGIIIGMVVSPKRDRYMGCFNGSNNGGCDGCCDGEAECDGKY